MKRFWYYQDVYKNTTTYTLYLINYIDKNQRKNNGKTYWMSDKCVSFRIFFYYDISTGDTGFGWSFM